MSPEEQKTEDELRQEIVTEYDFDETNDEESINKILELKKDRYSATNQKKEAQKESDNRNKRKEELKGFLKEAGFDPNTGKKVDTKVDKETPPELNKQKETTIPSDDKAYLYAQGDTRTEVRYLEKVMKMTGKSWTKAKEDNLYIAWQKDNDKLITRRGSQLKASRGGGERTKSEQSETTAKMAEELPEGFEYKPKK